MKRENGFTLVELLVVIAIIITLSGILFPVFARAREKAQQTKCVNNLKQMGAAIAMYEDDYDNIMPFFVSNLDGISWMFFGYSWEDLMEPYAKQLKKGEVTYHGYNAEQEGELFQCPSATTVESATVAIQATRSYGYNVYLGWNTPASAIKYPASTLRITESLYYDPDNPPASPRGGSWEAPLPDPIRDRLWAPGWHNGNNDVLWFDGHVSTIPRERVMQSDGITEYDLGPTWPRTGNVWCRLSIKPNYLPD